MSTVDRTQTESSAVSRSTVRSTAPCHGRSGLTLCMSCTPVDWAVDRPSPLVAHILACSMRSLAPLSSDLCATFFHLLYLLFPYNLFLSNSNMVSEPIKIHILLIIVDKLSRSCTRPHSCSTCLVLGPCFRIAHMIPCLAMGHASYSCCCCFHSLLRLLLRLL